MEEFEAKGDQVGTGEELKAGELLAETKRGKLNGKASEVTKDRHGWYGVSKGAAESIYAQAPPAATAASGDEATTPTREQPRPRLSSIDTDITQQPSATSSSTTITPDPSSASSSSSTSPGSFDRFAADGPSSSMKSPVLDGQPGLPPPKTPVSRRLAKLQLDTPPPRNIEFGTLSPSTIRTPLGATAPLPETPLKHPHHPPVPGSDRKGRPNMPPLAAPGTPEAQPRGLGLGLTPTRTTAPSRPFGSPTVSRGTPLNQQFQSMDASSDSPTPQGTSADAGYFPLVSAPMLEPSSSQDTVMPSKDQQTKTDKSIEALANKVKATRLVMGSSASRWATPEASQQQPAAPLPRVADKEQSTPSKLGSLLRRMSAPSQDIVSSPASASSTETKGPSPKKTPTKLTNKEKRDRAKEKKASKSPIKSPQPDDSNSLLAAAAPVDESKTPLATPVVASTVQFDGPTKATGLLEQVAKGQDPSGDVVLPEKLSHDHTKPSGPIEAEEAVSSAPAPQSEDAPFTTPTKDTEKPPSAPSTPQTHFDWADDGDEDDELPDLGDWGITVPSTPAKSTLPTAESSRPADVPATQHESVFGSARSIPPKSGGGKSGNRKRGGGGKQQTSPLIGQSSNGRSGNHHNSVFSGEPSPARELLPATQGSAKELRIAGSASSGSPSIQRGSYQAGSNSSPHTSVFGNSTTSRPSSAGRPAGMRGRGQSAAPAALGGGATPTKGGKLNGGNGLMGPSPGSGGKGRGNRSGGPSTAATAGAGANSEGRWEKNAIGKRGGT